MRPWTGWVGPHTLWVRRRLQWGHGLAAVDGADGADQDGAMLWLQWGHGLAAVDGNGGAGEPGGHGTLQWGHGLAAVDGLDRGAPRRLPCGFNGATALRPWTVGPPAGAGHEREASMGPRPCGRGRITLHKTMGMEMGLQWGHGLAAVDGRPPAPDSGDDDLLQWGHGLAAVDGCASALKRTATPCFNGATALRPWTAMRGAGGVLTVWAASMGPRPCGRGRLGVRRVDGLCQGASMGPRPCGRGRDESSDGALERVAGLQWGHGLAAVDGGQPRRPYQARTRGLQWGHGLAAVDGRRSHAAAGAEGLASMGPRPCGRGRRAVPRAPVMAPASFNGATALRPWTEATMNTASPA